MTDFDYTNTGVMVGDIFVASWGYDQTNIDYYKVVSVSPSGKTVKVVKIGQTFESLGGAYGDRVLPNPEHERGEVTTHRVQWTEKWRKGDEPNEPYFKVRSWGVWAYPWNGKSQYQTDPVFGH